MNRPNKLTRYITVGWKGLPGTNTQLIGPIIKCFEYETWGCICNALFHFNQKMAPKS
jgi:hypothetical protein